MRWHGIILLSAALLSACTPTGWERDRYYSGDSDLAASRARLAAELAADARQALARGDDREALRWGSMAAHLDPQYRELEAEATHRLAAARLRQAEEAARQDQLLIARSAVDAALDLQPEMPEALALRDLINQREAELYLAQAEAHLAADEIHAAIGAVGRAERLDSESDELARVRAAVTEIDRERRAARLIEETQALLVQGLLNDAEARLESLKALGLDDAQIAPLRTELEERREQAMSLFETGNTALRVGDYESALGDLTNAAAISQDLDIAKPLSDARFGIARDEFVAAMEAGDRITAFEAAHRMAEIRPQPEMLDLVEQIGREVITHTQTSARELLAQGKRDEAIAHVRTVLERVESPDLEALLKEIESESGGG